MSLETGQRLGPYEIIEPVGSGGMGEVYRALDHRLDRHIALKILPAEMAEEEETVSRFQREAKALATLHHPNIVVIHSVETIEDRQLITMELVDGKSLDELIPENGFDLDDFLEIAIPLTRALSAAHDAGVVHRDLKPHNIMVTGDGAVKILDFGLAKRNQPAASPSTADEVTEKALTQKGMIIGTAPYMSPEQIQGWPVDHRSDVFSLGIIFYEMLTGDRPFAGNSLVELASSILKDEPRSIDEARPEVPEQLSDVLRRCLAKDREERYGSLHEAARDLQMLESSSAPGEIRIGWKTAAGAVAVLLVVLAAAFLRPDDPAQPGSPPESPAPQEIDSLAVLPLANLSGDPGQDYFAAGMTDAIINDLAKLEGLRVTSRTSVLRYRGSDIPLTQIAEELGVEAIIEGSVMRSGTQVRINSTLVDARSEQSLWAESYQDEVRDILSLQSRVARDIADQISVAISPEEEARLRDTREVDPEAYEAYLRGRFLWSQPGGLGGDESIAYFREALRIDPEYALAHAALADIYLTSAHFRRPPHEAMPLAKEQALEALRIDPLLAQAHAAYADAVFHYDWNWDLAEQEFRRAIELNPSYEIARWWYAGLLAALGRHDEAAREIEIAQELDPMPQPAIRSFALRIHYWARRPDRIAETAARFAKHDEQIDTGALMGVAIFSRVMENEPISPAQIERIRNQVEQRPLAAVELAAIERSADAHDGLRRLEKIYEESYISPYMIAIGWAFQGEAERALDWLDQAVEDRAADLIWINVEPAFDDLRGNERFEAIVEEMNFPREARPTAGMRDQEIVTEIVATPLYSRL